MVNQSYINDGAYGKVTRPPDVKVIEQPKPPTGTVPKPTQPVAPVTTMAAPTTPTVTPVKTAAPPSGSVGLADTLRGQGYDVNWTRETGVTVNGKPIDTSKFTLVNGKYYGNSNDINNALLSSGVIANQNIVPAPQTALVPNQTQAPANQQGFDELMSILMGLVNSPDTAPKYMSTEEARAMAANELNPEFNSAMTELNRLLNIDMEKRGIFNSPLASGIFTDKNAALEASRQAEIAKRTTGIIQQDKADANTAAQLAAQAKNARMDALGSLLNTLSNRELTTAEMTGVINGVKTLAAQEFEETKKMNKIKTDLSVAELTGLYNGIPTLAGRDQEVKAWATKLDAAMSEVATFGKVMTKESADVLGVPVGTQSYDAIKAAEDRAFEWKTLMTEISSRNSSSNESSTTLNQDLAMWEIMGIAPDTDNLRAYGVVPGTKWNQSAADKLAEKQAAKELQSIEEEERFMNQVRGAAQQYRVSEDTAAALVALFENRTRETAFAKFNAQKEALKAEGVDVVFLEKQLNSRYPETKKSTVPAPTSSTEDPTRGSMYDKIGQKDDGLPYR